MPSAGRPFTPEVLTRLVARGVGVVPIVLHTGVASLEASEPPYPEYYRVTRATAHRVNDTRREGGRVIAVGTTVVRALETVVDSRKRGPRRARVDRHGGDPGPPGIVCRRAAHRLARARSVASRHAGGDRRPATARALVRGGALRGVPVARIRRRPSDPAVSAEPVMEPGGTSVEPPLAAMPTTRRAILMALKRNGSMRAHDLAEALGITVAAVRQQLLRLSEDGLVTHRRDARGPGPAIALLRARPDGGDAVPQALRRPHHRAARLSRRPRQLRGDRAVRAAPPTAPRRRPGPPGRR